MLIKCPECDLQVSDKAYSCPHCGYPMTPAVSTARRRSNKRKRLPNGFGQISKVKGNLRKPYRAMVTVGKTEEGRPICKLLKPEAYFETYNDAYAALLEYNRDPSSIDRGISVLELYERWCPKYYEKLSPESIKRYRNAWRNCTKIYKIPVKDLRIHHIKQCIEGDGNIIPTTQKAIKTLFNHMLEYAVEYEIVEKNYARMFKLDKEISDAVSTPSNKHISFSDDEMNALWENINEPGVKALLIQCYGGWRPQELIKIRLEDVDLEQNIIVGGMKTEAGKNRIVPIHSKIRPFVEEFYKESVRNGNTYLLSYKPEFPKYTYGTLWRQYKQIFTKYNFSKDHRPHDGRVQFVTMAKQCGVDEYAIKYIVGHVIADLTENVYADRSVEWLKEEIEKIK